MKFKWLSGDFLSEYNKALSDLRVHQAELDEKYEVVIGELVKRETSRLEKAIPIEHPIGTKVINSHGNTGVIIGSHIDLVVKTHAKSDIDQEVVGPNKYWSVTTPDEENIMTCEGMLRLYDVQFDSHELEKDWGVDYKVLTMYSDEFELAEEE